MKKNYSLQRQYIYRGWILPPPMTSHICETVFFSSYNRTANAC